MFTLRKKNAPRPGITVWDESGRVLYDGLLTGLILPDQTVKDLSRQYLNDPEPCEIHRSAVMSWVFAELEEALTPDIEVDIDTMDDQQIYFSGYPGARRVRLTVRKGGD